MKNISFLIIFLVGYLMLFCDKNSRFLRASDQYKNITQPFEQSIVSLDISSDQAVVIVNDLLKLFITQYDIADTIVSLFRKNSVIGIAFEEAFLRNGYNILVNNYKKGAVPVTYKLVGYNDGCKDILMFMVQTGDHCNLHLCYFFTKNEIKLIVSSVFFEKN